MTSTEASTQQLDLALSELDDIYKELKELKNEPNASHSNSTPQHNSQKNNKGRVAVDGPTKTEYSATTSRVSLRRKEDRSTTSDQRTMTSHPEEVDSHSDSRNSGYDNKRFTLGEEIPFPPPPVNSPPPQDEYVMRSVFVGHSESDYDEVPSEDEFQHNASLAVDDEIPDYDEIPDEPPQQDVNGTYVSMETLPYRKSRLSSQKESPFPTYSVVNKSVQKASVAVEMQPITHNSASFYDNYQSNETRTNGVEKSQQNGKPSPPVNNNTNKPSVTSLEPTDDEEWDDESVDERKTQTINKSVSISAPKQTNGNIHQVEEEIIDCTQEKPSHEEGEFLCCRLLMSLGIVLVVALFLATVIIFIYYGISLDRLGTTFSNTQGGNETNGS